MFIRSKEASHLQISDLGMCMVGLCHGPTVCALLVNVVKTLQRDILNGHIRQERRNSSYRANKTNLPSLMQGASALPTMAVCGLTDIACNGCLARIGPDLARPAREPHTTASAAEFEFVWHVVW